jgi:hypothetical protein
MGLTPRDVGQMSFWEYGACLAAHNRANGGPPKPKAPSAAQHRERMMRHL